jgi:hypothetical protein
MIGSSKGWDGTLLVVDVSIAMKRKLKRNISVAVMKWILSSVWVKRSGATASRAEPHSHMQYDVIADTAGMQARV